MDPDREEPKSAISRRQLLVGAAGASIGIAAGAGAMAGFERRDNDADAGAARSSGPIPFYGAHQAGIATPMQERLYFGAFDLITERREDIADLLKEWTLAASRMCAGQPVADLSNDPIPAPEDTGEALGLSHARLTITVGFGPTLFERDGVDRYGLAAQRPAALADMPRFSSDALDPDRSDGDLFVQACADDPVVAFHAVRNLGRIATGVAVPRWSQAGFGRTSATTRDQTTERNLMGFKDGTNNIRAEDVDALNEHVWAGEEAPAWMRNGTYGIVRRIRMRIEAWDNDSLADQERRIGRVKSTGAPLGSAGEFDPVDLNAKSAGRPVIPAGAHIRVSSPEENGGARILRRGYNYSDGIDADGGLDAGLFFICYQRDPRAQFIAIQSRLAESDALNLYLVHTSSAIFAVPPAPTENDYLARALFDA